MNWNGQGLTRTHWPLPISPAFGQKVETPFDVSPDGRYPAIDTDQVLQENVGMIENVR